MEEGSDLPKELLESIAELLQDPFHYLHFRSVCSSWRHAAPRNPPRFSSPSQIHVVDGISAGDGAFCLSRRIILQLGLPESHRQIGSTDWLIKIQEIIPQKMHIVNPLTSFKIEPLPPELPRILDCRNIQISRVCEEYVLEYVAHHPRPNPLADMGNLYMEKVAFASDPSGAFTILTIHLSGKLAIFKSSNKEWSVIQDLPSPFEDVIFFDDKFYAVDYTGQLVMVNTEGLPSINFTSVSVLGGDKKCLLGCDKDLLLVDIFLSTGVRDDLDDENFDYVNDDNGDDEFVSLMSERKVRFEVYKLNLQAPKWVRLSSLNNWILFLGNNCAFSVLASNFSGCKGNIIYFTDYTLNSDTDDSFFKCCHIRVYDMNDGTFYNLPNDKCYSELLWPPPSWLTSISFQAFCYSIQGSLEQLKL